jgi:hypothetical protein
MISEFCSFLGEHGDLEARGVDILHLLRPRKFWMQMVSYILLSLVAQAFLPAQ